MGLLSRFRKKKIQEEKDAGQEFLEMAYAMKKISQERQKKQVAKKNATDPEVEDDKIISTEIENYDVDFHSKADRERYIRGYCEQIIEASRQNEEAKLEYQAVTSYLTDIQKIDRIEGEEKESLVDAARNVVTLTRERHEYQDKKEIKLAEKQYKYFEKNEAQLPEDIKKLDEYESYNSKIKNDMRHLEGEKSVLRHQKKEYAASQRYLKKIAITTSILVFTMVVLFYVLDTVAGRNMQLPYLLTIALAGISGLYIFLEGRKNAYNLKLTQIKLNKAITLLNTVKIKYVNSTNCIDYACRKYNVNSAMELRFQWEQYSKAKKLQQELVRNTEKMNEHNKKMLEILKNHEISDLDIWTYQAGALIDGKEMVEIRHRLNGRRQKIRERIEYNTNIREKGFAKLTDLVEKIPEAKQEVAKVLEENHITV
ncbi:hypothetical protein [Anaerosporobacter faecicola]|uniref:hypothetical protein n=1 Tax=Anaerosporobacter faecicola TaxID=2718714 RepID=UPI00143C11F7|nr:hypothetical protein [Anaerosporobacter faecicola]